LDDVRYILVFILFIVFPLPALADITGHPRIVDGDTIWIGSTKIRFHGIDAPESKQTCTADGNEWPCGKEATTALIEATGDRPVNCLGDNFDRYKRLIAVCYIGNTNLNASMVRNGWAMAYRKYSTDYVDEETIAKESKAGMWRGKFMPPWEWRKK
jgi:endonuclease YncB( thermonuclease family)